MKQRWQCPTCEAAVSRSITWREESRKIPKCRACKTVLSRVELANCDVCEKPLAGEIEDAIGSCLACCHFSLQPGSLKE